MTPERQNASLARNRSTSFGISITGDQVVMEKVDLPNQKN